MVTILTFVLFKMFHLRSVAVSVNFCRKRLQGIVLLLLPSKQVVKYGCITLITYKIRITSSHYQTTRVKHYVHLFIVRLEALKMSWLLIYTMMKNIHVSHMNNFYFTKDFILYESYDYLYIEIWYVELL